MENEHFAATFGTRSQSRHYKKPSGRLSWGGPVRKNARGHGHFAIAHAIITSLAPDNQRAEFYTVW